MSRESTTPQETAAAIVMRARRGEVAADELAVLAADPRASVRTVAARLERQARAAKKESQRLDGMLVYEQELWGRGLERIAGVDEAGAGPLAGPVLAAAVVLAPGARIERVNDSKMLSAEARQTLAGIIKSQAVAYAVASCSVEEIDTMNILRASREAMRRAVIGLGVAVDHILVDTRSVPHVDMPQTPIVKGDQKSLTIAAASILAKVARDGLMRELAEKHPGYGFEQHKGYGTRAHLEALDKLGPCEIHRRSFAPVRRLLAGLPGVVMTRRTATRRGKGRRPKAPADDRQVVLPF